jgi:type VI secretion system secreted protein VgrG
MVDAAKRAFQFHGGTLADGTLHVQGFTGVDRISELFRFEIDLVSTRADLDAIALLTNDAWLGIKQGTLLAGSGKRGVQELKVHGVLASFEQRGKGDHWVSYRAVLVPKLWRLTLTVQSRIFLDKSVVEIVTDVLKGAGLEDEDFQFKASARGQAKREYVVQYQESDFAFISRLLEHEGIFYHFEHRDARGKVVFGDGTGAYGKTSGAASLPYRIHGAGAGGSQGWLAEEAVSGLVVRHQVVPAGVVLGDFNYRTPAERLESEVAVDAKAAYGTHYEYGNHFKANDEGKALATVRAEELACRRQLAVGVSDARGLRAGGVFTLAKHYRGDCNIDHLVIEVAHHGSQEMEAAGGADEPSSSYGNEFLAIPAAVTFRPLRSTPRPVIPGSLNAKIDASGSGQYAELDDHGRYKVKIPFDRGDLQDGNASRFIRMAQPYAGENMGMHFPLHKGTEVVLTHINGDPDRPLIAAAVPNPQTASTVTGGNQSQSVIRTGGGNSISLEDTAGAEGFNVNATKDASTTVGNDSTTSVANNMSLSVGADRSASVGGNDSETVTGNQTATVSGNQTLTISGDQTSTIAGSRVDTVGVNLAITVGSNAELTVGANIAVAAGAAARVTAGASLGLTSPQISIDGAGQIVLKSGGSSIIIAPGGVTIHAPRILLTGGSEIGASAPEIKVAADGACKIGGGSIDLESMGVIALKGATIKNNG